MNQLIQLLVFGLTTALACTVTSCSDESGKATIVKTEKELAAQKADNQSGDYVTQTESPVNFTPSFSVRSQSNKQNTHLSLEKLKTSFRSKPQQFILSTKTDTLIIGKSGTRVHVPAVSFVDKAGKEALGEIVFSLIECYSPLEMYAHNLSTFTAEGRLLETGGSVFTDVTQAGEQLQLKPGKKLQMDFPKGESDLPGMQEFKGVTNADGIVEWNNAAPERRTSTKFTSSTEFGRNGALNVVSNAAPRINLIEMQKEKEETDLSSLKLDKEEGTLADWIEKQPLKKGTLSEKFVDGYEVELRMSFDKKGKIAELKSTRLVEQTLLDELYRFFLKAPAVSMSKIQARELYQATLRGKMITKEKELREYYAKNNLPWDPAFDEGLAQEMEYYTLNIGWIGWVNCDRFSNDSREKVSMTMHADEKTSVFMIFSKIASQIAPARYNNTAQFHAVPLGEPIRIIAIRIENDVVFMDRIDREVSAGFVNLNLTTRVSKEEIQKAFEF